MCLYMHSRFNNNGYAPPTITWDNNTKPISPGRQDRRWYTTNTNDTNNNNDKHNT